MSAQGISVEGRRPKSKKEIKEAIALGKRVRLFGTSMMGDQYEGSITDAPDGTYTFVGPDPYTRRFYGKITKRGDKIKVE